MLLKYNSERKWDSLYLELGFLRLNDHLQQLARYIWGTLLVGAFLEHGLLEKSFTYKTLLNIVQSATKKV